MQGLFEKSGGNPLFSEILSHRDVGDMNLVGDKPANDVAGELLGSGFRTLRRKASGKRKVKILPEHARGPGALKDTRSICMTSSRSSSVIGPTSRSSMCFVLVAILTSEQKPEKFIHFLNLSSQLLNIFFTGGSKLKEFGNNGKQ